MKLTNLFLYFSGLAPSVKNASSYFDVKFLTYRSIINGAKNALFQVY
ncbi:hypothetical protein A4U88_4446 [Serratia marcescens]|nr:hypothetical protein A4U88_4446 [Serratia marcescens]